MIYKRTVTDFTKVKLNELNRVPFDLNFYKKIIKIQSPTRLETKMKEFIKSYIKGKFENTIIEFDEFGNMYITKGNLMKGEYYPCIVAHLDEVHFFNENLVIKNTDNFVFGWDESIGGTAGIGCDDKNGIYIALTMLDHFDHLKLFFPVQEESGTVGTLNSDMSWFEDVGYLIQPDRNGNSDIIVHTNGVNVTSDKFMNENDNLFKRYKYKKSFGTCTDIGSLVLRSVNVSAVNLSCGYINEHTSQETTHIPSLINCLNLVYHLISDNGCQKFIHEPDFKDNLYSSNSYFDDFFYDYYDEF